MKTLRDETRECLTELTPDGDGAVRAVWCFPRTFSGFKGHFPGNAVCPGVCLIQAQISVAEKLLDRRLRLVDIEKAKFMWPVFPERKIEGTLSVRKLTSGTFQIKSSVKLGERPIAQFLLRVNLEKGIEP